MTFMGRMINISLGLLLCVIAVGGSFKVSIHSRKILEHKDPTPTTTIESTTIVQNHTTPTFANVSTHEPNTTTPIPSDLRQTAADVAIAVIIIIVITVILGMGIYFIRKFEQLNRMVPTYRYSSLKTEVNGVNGIDDKIESQYLVCASTEEEDFEDEEVSLPPTLVVHSQTTLSSSKADSFTVRPASNIATGALANASEAKQMVATDSDDELLQ